MSLLCIIYSITFHSILQVHYHMATRTIQNSELNLVLARLISRNNDNILHIPGCIYIYPQIITLLK